MPTIDWSNMDGAAVIALGFLGVVLALSLGLFGWLGYHMMKRDRS